MSCRLCPLNPPMEIQPRPCPSSRQVRHNFKSTCIHQQANTLCTDWPAWDLPYNGFKSSRVSMELFFQAHYFPQLKAVIKRSCWCYFPEIVVQPRERDGVVCCYNGGWSVGIFPHYSIIFSTIKGTVSPVQSWLKVIWLDMSWWGRQSTAIFNIRTLPF